MIASCRECNGKVSSEATQCPHCGAPGPTGARVSSEIERQLKDLNRRMGTLTTAALIVTTLVVLYFAYDLLIWIERRVL